MAASKAVLSFESNITAKICDFMLARVFCSSLAATEYQELGKEAQVAVGIPEKYQVPVKKFPSILSSHQALAFTMPGALYVNEDRLKSEAYGVKRCALFIKAVHKKYSDVSTTILLELSALYASTRLAQKIGYSLLGLPNFTYFPVIVAAGLSGMYCVGSAYGKYTDRRADSEGHYATQCAVCVKESALWRRSISEIEEKLLVDRGYLLPDALEAIAKDLTLENKLCRFHGEVH